MPILLNELMPRSWCAVCVQVSQCKVMSDLITAQIATMNIATPRARTHTSTDKQTHDTNAVVGARQNRGGVHFMSSFKIDTCPCSTRRERKSA